MKRRIVAFALVATCLVSVAVAATDDGTFTGSSNRKFYTPATCSVSVRSNGVSFSSLSWEEGQDFALIHYWEGEIRGTNDYNIAQAYSGVTGIASNLPQAYKEYDEDDLSIGTANPFGITKNYMYYGEVTAESGPNFSTGSGVDLLVESEYGIWGGVDGLPLAYQVFDIILNTRTQTNVAWAD